MILNFTSSAPDGGIMDTCVGGHSFPFSEGGREHEATGLGREARGVDKPLVRLSGHSHALECPH